VPCFCQKKNIRARSICTLNFVRQSVNPDLSFLSYKNSLCRGPSLAGTCTALAVPRLALGRSLLVCAVKLLWWLPSRPRRPKRRLSSSTHLRPTGITPALQQALAQSGCLPPPSLARHMLEAELLARRPGGPCTVGTRDEYATRNCTSSSFGYPGLRT
jgi:hypothetical protein